MRVSNVSLLARYPRSRGSTLVVAVFVIALLATFIGLAVDYTGTTATATRRGADLTNAQALANGALEVVYKRWQYYMASKQAGTIPVAPSATNYTSAANLQPLANAVLPTIQSAATSSGFTVTSLTVTPVDRTDSPIVSQYSGTTLPTGSGTTGPMANVPGWIAQAYTYRIRATVAKVNDPTFSVTVSRYFQQANASIFQAMLFFQNDLELHPGPAMTLYGPVHTNKNLYGVAGSGGSLNYDGAVSYHGDTTTLNPSSTHPSNFFEKPDGYVEGVTQTLYNQESGNWNSYKNPTFTTSMNAQLTNVQSLDPLGMSETNAVDPTNGNASGTHEIIERPVPVSATNPSANTAVADPDAFAAHRIFNSAGLRIIINRNSTGQKVRVYAPTDIVNNTESSTEIVPTGSTVPASQNIADQVIAAITVDNTGSIYDFREGRTINADTVDMSKLTPALNGYASYNGVVYITDATNADSNGNTGNSDAIRLKKGGVLPDAGLTIATDGAIYVQGDYNTGTTYGADGLGNAVTTTSQPVSNQNSDPTQYTVSGYTQKPASVMGDAVMILSNAWTDTNSSLAIATRNATPTTMNSAIVSGQVLTTSSAASGGAHNFPRFLENWGGDNFTYHGSMCELYASIHFTGTYGKANVYSPPNRRWFFDNSFLLSPPPGNLRTTTYTRGRWVRESSDFSL